MTVASTILAMERKGNSCCFRSEFPVVNDSTAAAGAVSDSPPKAGWERASVPLCVCGAWRPFWDTNFSRHLGINGTLLSLPSLQSLPLRVVGRSLKAPHLNILQDKVLLLREAWIPKRLAVIAASMIEVPV